MLFRDYLEVVQTALLLTLIIITKHECCVFFIVLQHWQSTHCHWSHFIELKKFKINKKERRISFSSLGRVGIDYEPQSHVEIERDLEIRQMQVRETLEMRTSLHVFFFNSNNNKESLYNGRSSTYQPVLISNYSYDPRLHAAPATNNSNSKSSMSTLNIIMIIVVCFSSLKFWNDSTRLRTWTI